MEKKNTLYLDVVSAQESIFSGDVVSLQVSGTAGELGIFPGHTPLLSGVKPGSVKIVNCDGNEEYIYLSGGILEVQPHIVTILADVAIRGKDLDEKAAQEAKDKAEQRIKTSSGDFNYAEAALELANAVAKLRVMKLHRNKNKLRSSEKNISAIDRFRVSTSDEKDQQK